MKKCMFKKIFVLILTVMIGVQSFLFAPHIQAMEMSDIVSVRTVDRDIMIGTTENSLFSSEDVAKNMDLDSALVGQSYKMSTTNIDATDLSNWYVYDHYDTKAYEDELAWENQTGYNKNLRPYYEFSEQVGFVGENQPLDVDEALEKSKESMEGNVYFLKEHISASSENGNAAMKFYGYGTTGCSDFLFYPAQETGTKKVEYTINAKDVKTHSLAQAGFLFNCGITDEKLSGYAMLFTFKAGIASVENDSRNVSASGIQSVSIYKITNLPLDIAHEDSNYFNPIMLVAQQYLTELKKVDLSTIAFTNHFDISNIEMQITSGTLKVRMTEAGLQAGDNPETMTLVEMQNMDSSNETYCENYTPSGFGGFGPIVTYQHHACMYTSSYIYSNLKMSIAESESVLSGLSNADYTRTKVENGQYVDNDKYFILIGDNKEGEEGYKDCFKRDYDDVYLEMLKKQEVILITNLNIDNVEGNINGTNYRLKDYLGEANVIQITGETAEELAANIQAAILNSQYSKEDANQALDALDEVTGTGHTEHATAKCMVTYKGLQVDKINISRLAEQSAELLIDDTMSINTSNPIYTLRRPDGTTEILPDNKLFIQGPQDWPTGEYVVSVSYAQGVSAKTSFSISSSYNSYFNGVSISEGLADDHLSCLSNTVGVNKVTPQKAYHTGLVADEGYSLPKNIVVKTDYLTSGTQTDANGIVRDENGNAVALKTLTEGTDYIYNSSTGAIEVKEECVVGNVYIYADTAKVSYRLTCMTAGENPVTSVSSYDNTDFVANLATNPTSLPMPESVSVIIDNNEYKITKGITKRVLKGTISYLENELRISSQLLGKDITIQAATGNFHLYYNTNIDCVSGGAVNAAITYGEDYDSVLTLEKGYMVSQVSASLGVATDADGNPLTKPESFSYEAETGAIHIDGEDIIDDIYISITAEAKKYAVVGEISDGELEGQSFCMADCDYSARLKADFGYELPEQIMITVAGQPVPDEYYEYNEETGDIWIDGGFIRGDIFIKAGAKKKIFSVSSQMKNLLFEGASSCHMLEDYTAMIQAIQSYELPESIRVFVGDEETDGFTYDSQTGELVISKNVIRGNVNVLAEGKAKNYPVRAEVGNLSFQGDATGTVEQDYNGTLVAQSGYLLPQTITIKVGEQELMQEDYSYDKITGEFTIFKGKIVNDVLVQADASPVIVPAKEYHVSFRLSNLTVNGSNKASETQDYVATLIPDANYGLPTNFNVKAGEIVLQPGVDYGYNGVTGVLTIPAERIVGDIVVEAAGVIVKKQEQKKPDVKKLTVIPPKYENSFDGKVIGVNANMEYSIDGGKTWIPCKGDQITGLGTGKLGIRFSATGEKNNSPIANIEIDSATMEYYIPTISMSKLMGKNKKFQLKIMNMKGAAIHVASSNPSIVTINRKGVITSKKKTGKAKVVVTIIKGKHIVQYAAHVKVVNNVKKNYSLSKFKTSYKEPAIALYKKVNKGKKWKIKLTHTKNAKISFRSSNTNVAVVSKDGTVKGKRSGNTRITITVANGGVVDQYYVVLRVFKKGEKTDVSYLKEIKKK